MGRVGIGRVGDKKSEPHTPFELRLAIFISSNDSTPEHGSLESKIRVRQLSSPSSSLGVVVER